jgi:hypothetical protein
MNKALQNYECEGQLSIFDGFLTELCDTKPEIGRKLVFIYEGQEYPCIVEAHCGYDFFWVRFTDNAPEHAEGWHLSLRGYGESWKYTKEPTKPDITDDYIKEHPTCFYVFGHYLDREDGWHKVPDELPTFTEWTTIDVVLFGKKTGTPWMEHGKWEAKDWTFRSLDERRDTESTEFLAWKVSD